MDGNEGDEVSLSEVSLSEVSLSEILDELELPPAVLGHWWDHLDAFFTRHGGARRYGALVALVAEGRAAQAAASRGGGAG